ncbi:MAG: hypothetical protein AAGF86_13125 [Pseudomonadota bacterium]
MIVNLAPRSSDDPIFIVALNGMLANLVDAHRPNEVHFIRIDRWFDNKWLGYSGKGRVAFEEGQPFMDTALDAFWNKKLTFPPFNPNRVLEQTSFGLAGGAYTRKRKSRPIHPAGRTHSSKNLQRRVCDFTQSGLFVWFSSDTLALGRSSILCYSVDGKKAGAWFASFLRTDDGWQVHRTKGMDRNAAAKLFPIGNAVRRA